jgi:hypothetical protein
MDLYGYNEAISQGNSYNSETAEGNAERRIRNQNLDSAIGTLKASIPKADKKIDADTKSAQEENLVETAIDGYGLKKVNDAYKKGSSTAKDVESLVKNKLNSNPIPQAEASSGGELSADVNAVLDNEKSMTALQSGVKGGTEGSEAVQVADDVEKLEAPISKGIGMGAKVVGGAGALLSGGMAIEDLESSSKKNTAEKIGDYLTIGGSTSELVGLGLSVTPLGIALDIVGGATSLLGSAFSEYGKEEASKTAKQNVAKQTKAKEQTLASQKQADTPASATAGGFGSTAQYGGSSEKTIQASGSF